MHSDQAPKAKKHPPFSNSPRTHSSLPILNCSWTLLFTLSTLLELFSNSSLPILQLLLNSCLHILNSSWTLLFSFSNSFIPLLNSGFDPQPLPPHPTSISLSLDATQQRLHLAIKTGTITNFIFRWEISKTTVNLWVAKADWDPKCEKTTNESGQES